MPKQKNRRKIHIGDDVWTYKVGRHAGYINIWTPQGVRINTTESDVSGIDNYSLEKDYWNICTRIKRALA